jgi:WD40 repeat protein
LRLETKEVKMGVKMTRKNREKSWCGWFRCTIRIWDARTGAAIGQPLKGHTGSVRSVACSPDGQHIISGSNDRTIRIWDARTGAAIGQPLEGHTSWVSSVACSPDGQHIISGSADMTIRIWDARPGATIGQPHAHLFAQPNTEGWVKDSQGGLLYWVSTNHCKTLHSPALMTIPSTSPIRSVSLDFQDFVFGIHWSQIFNGTQ